MLANLRRLLLTAAWAPLAVLIFHAVIASTSLREPLDFLMHFLGGASIAFFIYHALQCFEALLGRNTPLGYFLHSFALACTAGLFWEFAELASDVFCGTHIQNSLRNTMSDLIADATGATAALALVFLTRLLIGKRRARFRRD